jgi:hypothetical protein
MSWQSYNQTLIRYPHLGFSLDLSLMDIAPDHVAALQPRIAKAFADMEAVEAGDIANPDEGRMVGHYWLRNPDLAPTEALKKAITGPLDELKRFADKIHSGAITPPTGGQFRQLLLIGIGGSALGLLGCGSSGRPFVPGGDPGSDGASGGLDDLAMNPGASCPDLSLGNQGANSDRCGTASGVSLAIGEGAAAASIALGRADAEVAARFAMAGGACSDATTPSPSTMTPRTASFTNGCP